MLRIWEEEPFTACFVDGSVSLSYITLTTNFGWTSKLQLIKIMSYYESNQFVPLVTRFYTSQVFFFRSSETSTGIFLHLQPVVPKQSWYNSNNFNMFCHMLRILMLWKPGDFSLSLQVTTWWWQWLTRVLTTHIKISKSLVFLKERSYTPKN